MGSIEATKDWVQEALGVDVKILKPPMAAKLFPMAMMMGMMVLMVTVVIGIVVATLSYDYWNHSIATQLNPSTDGLLSDLGTINAVKLWLEPLKSVGLALATIVRALRWQANRLWEIIA